MTSKHSENLKRRWASATPEQRALWLERIGQNAGRRRHTRWDGTEYEALYRQLRKQSYSCAEIDRIIEEHIAVISRGERRYADGRTMG